MKKKVKNPFVTGGYIAPKYFCNRQNETNRLLQAITSGRNVTLISLRRMGKTGLLKHTAFLLENSNKPRTVLYVDLLPTMSAKDFLNTISSALFRLIKDQKSFFDKALGVLSYLRPKISIDTLTGQLSIELKTESPVDVQYGFEHLMQFISEIKKEIVFMLDEFQQISNYSEKNIEQMLRTVIQSYPHMPFVFSGSSKHMLEPMFMSANRPFYQSSELMYLDKIHEEDYRHFITELFLSENRIIEDDQLADIFNWTRLHTFYVQYVCNLLFETGEKIIHTDVINNVFHRILTSYEPLFASYRTLLPPHQFRLLQAIASESKISQPTSSEFINKYDLTSASSVSTSLKALMQKEMIIKENNEWQVYDVFFSRWLEYHYSHG